MVEARIANADEWLSLIPDEINQVVQTLTAHLASNGLCAVRTVVRSYSEGFADLAEFFAGCERDWRGWERLRRWRSAEGDLTIEARHEYRHVQLRVTLSSLPPGRGNDGWKVTAELTIDPGEQLSQAAQDLRSLAGG
jgi:hypothetical protein